jgi:hypothetical protein
MVLHFLSPAGDRIRAATPYLDPRVLGSFALPWVSSFYRAPHMKMLM